MVKNKIVLVPFPFDNFKKFKVRPAICLTEIFGKKEQVIIVFITSKYAEDLDSTDILLSEKDEGFQQTGLIVKSAIKLQKIVTIPVRFIKRELGELPAARMEELNTKLRRVFDL